MIVLLYDRLIDRHDSPLYRLNRAIARGQSGERDRARRELEALGAERALEDYLLLDCARARLHELEGEFDAARRAYVAALGRGVAPHERALLERRIARLEGKIAGSREGP